jgi:two-component system, response regulator YesN
MIFKKMFILHKFYFKILFSFSILSILIVLTTSIFISSIYMKNVYTQLEDNYSNTLDRLNNNFDNIFSSLNQLNVNLRQYPEVNTFLISKTADTQTIMNITSLLVPITSMNPYIYSTILYNKDYRYPISSGKSGVNLSQFINSKLKHPNIKSNLNIVYTDVNQYQTIGLKPLSALSIIFSDNENVGQSIDNAIIMTLDVDEIRKNVLSKYDGITIVTDDSSNIIFSNYDTNMDNSIKSGNYLKRIIASKSTSGDFRAKIGNDTKIITFTKNASTSFYIINIRSYQGIKDIIYSKVFNIVLICLGIIILYSIVAYFVSRKIYSPIGKTTKMFSSFSKSTLDSETDELSFISKVFSETVEELNKLEIKNKDKISKLKVENLKSILRNNVIPSEVRDEILSSNLNVSFSNLILLSLKIDNYYEIDRNERYAYENTLCIGIPDLIKDTFNCEVVNLYKGEIAVLMNFKSEIQNSFEVLVTETEKIISAIHKTMEVNITAGIGGIANNMEECSIIYSHALEMVKHRFVIGMNMVIYQEYLDNNLTNDISISKETEVTLVNSIKLRKKLSYIENINYITDLLKKCVYSKAVSMLFQVMTICIQAINETVAQEESNYSLNFEEFNQLFNKLQTVEDAKKWLLNIYNEYEQAYEEVLKLRSNKHGSLVKKMEDYIKQNYTNNGICLDVIAEITGYAPYYISKIFKEITGSSINDYIREVRITSAKKLLETTNVKASEIGFMTGFSNTSNFYLVFKKDVGLAPVEYRQLKLSHNGTVTN